MRHFSILCCLLLPAGAAAQNSYNWWDARPPDAIAKPIRPAASTPIKKDTATSVVLTTPEGKPMTVECIPNFPGGYSAFLAYIDKKIKRPRGPRQRGPVQVTLTVLATGATIGTHIKPGNGLSPAYDAALLEAMNGMPKFSPGGCNGNAKTMEVTFPYSFR